MTSDRTYAESGRPKNVSALGMRLRNIAADDADAQRLLRGIAHVVIAQLLPGGVVKGGTAIKLRGGEATTRFTTDLDAARPAQVPIDEYIAEFKERLLTGWNGFTADVVARLPSQPKDVPVDYVMRPYDVKLKYNGRAVRTVTVELGHDEIGSTTFPVHVMAPEVAQLFVRLGFPAPDPVAVLAAEYQIAQKLHACTTPNTKIVAKEQVSYNDRAHDIVDIQLLVELEPPDLTTLNRVGERIFDSRRSTTWPPVVSAFDGWDALYAAAAEGLQVRPLADAIVW